MKTEEAIEIINGRIEFGKRECSGVVPDYIEALELAVEALRKQEPKTWGRCPCCWGSVWGTPDRCPNCGQIKLGCFYGRDVEVIGNIHDNPELMDTEP